MSTGHEPTWVGIVGISPGAMDNRCCKQLDELEDAVQRVRDLHHPHEERGVEVCNECSIVFERPNGYTRFIGIQYPCPTILAIGNLLARDQVNR